MTDELKPDFDNKLAAAISEYEKYYNAKDFSELDWGNLNYFAGVFYQALERCSTPEDNGWMPIGSAPRDSTEIFVCLNNGLGSMYIASNSGTDQWWSWPQRIPTPTHWMPLPQPPK